MVLAVSDYYDEPLPNGNRINIRACGGTAEASSRILCKGDFDEEGDADGKDLAS